MTSRRVAAMAVVTLAVSAPILAAQEVPIVGTWTGTSRCVDRAHFPACNDEQVIYDIRAVGAKGDSVSVRADKVVDGVRDFMGELAGARVGDGAWAVEFRNDRVHIRIVLRVSGGRLAGEMTDVTSGRRVRDIALQRAP